MLEMPGKRGSPWQRMTMRGIVGGIMGRWRRVFAVPCCRSTLPPTFLEPRPGSRAAAGDGGFAVPAPRGRDLLEKLPPKQPGEIPCLVCVDDLSGLPLCMCLLAEKAFTYMYPLTLAPPHCTLHTVKYQG